MKTLIVFLCVLMIGMIADAAPKIVTPHMAPVWDNAQYTNSCTMVVNTRAKIVLRAAKRGVRVGLPLQHPEMTNSYTIVCGTAAELKAIVQNQGLKMLPNLVIED